MTTHTDRKGAEILAALDKLAENGMPFIDVVKQGGFSGFPAKGAQPLPTEPVQIYEDSPFWNKVRDMAEHTDRIRQMAQEATAYADAMDGSGQMAGRAWSDVRDEYFAQLVAEDCARIVYENALACDDGSLLQVYLGSNAAAIRARYSLKD